MTIHVTQEHIDKGERKACCGCPVVLAIREATSEPRWRVPAHYAAYLGNMVIGLPDSVSDFIETFDASGPSAVSPFSFELPIERI